LFFDRSRRAGRFLEWKVRLFTLGAVLAVVGMATNQGWMTWLAIAVLVAGMMLRFLPGGVEAAEDEGENAG
jgi:hypothetical protein